MVVFVLVTCLCPSFHPLCYPFPVLIHDRPCHCLLMLYGRDCLGLFSGMLLPMLVVIDCTYYMFLHPSLDLCK